jgi:hypothetical protein
VHVMGAFIGVHRLQVHHVADDVVLLVRNAVAAVHVARLAGDVQGLAAVIALHHRDCDRCQAPWSISPPELQAALQAKRDLGLHVGQFLLHQLGAASGRPNCLRSSVYWRRASRTSAEPMTPQAMP